MSAPVPARDRWLWAAGLMLMFIPLGTFVTAHDRSLAALAARLFPDFTVQFAVSTVVTFGWISGADRMYRFLDHLWGARSARMGPVAYNMLNALPLFFAGMAALSMVLKFNEWLFYEVLDMSPGIADNERATRIILGLFAGLSLCVYMLIANHRIMESMKETLIKAEQLEKENLLSQFSALKSQVNPHFLFNSLSILSSLVKNDPELSERFIDRLSRAYRYILEQHENDLVPLSTELEFMNSYNFLLQTRFEHKFEVRIELDQDVIDNNYIAPLTLQMLVENAVKHNRMSVREPLVITIAAEDGALVVKNPNRPRGKEVHSTGLGLQNIINRYALLCSRPVWAGEQEDEFVVSVPLIHQNPMKT